jgi:hypothetical protein
MLATITAADLTPRGSVGRASGFVLTGYTEISFQLRIADIRPEAWDPLHTNEWRIRVAPCTVSPFSDPSEDADLA